MSYTTRCPACGTMFRVVPDQLKISDGWVRCGHCADVFDATLYLETWEPPAPADDETAASPVDAAVMDGAPTPDPATFAEPEPEAMPALSVERAGFEPTAPAALGRLPDALATTEGVNSEEGHEASSAPEREAVEPQVLENEGPLPAEASTPFEEPGMPAANATAAEATSSAAMASPLVPPAGPAGVEQVAAPDESFHADLVRFAAEASARAPESEQAIQLPDESPPVRGFSEPEERIARDERDLSDGAVPLVSQAQAEEPDVAGSGGDAGDEPGFMREARRQAFWRSPAVRAGLSVLVLMLSSLLVLQWAVHERDRLAASQPGLAPWLVQLCQPLGCRVAPPRHIESVVIDSSTLVRRLGNFYAFDLVIRNNAHMPLAVPALELSLTDLHDQVIARRIFLPEELPGAPALLPAEASLPLSLRLSIAADGGGDGQMAGYRALVFYP